VRETLASESDPAAAREQIRALGLLGAADDLTFAVTYAARWPKGMDDALALAVARRGGLEAIETYSAVLRKTRMTNQTEFFRQALWGHTDALSVAASRSLGLGDAPAWAGILRTLATSDAAMPAGPMAASLTAPSEEIRWSSVWFLVHAYGPDPSMLSGVVKDKLSEPHDELSSDREDFGRELLRRMTGGEKKDDPRWLKFLESEEADRLLRGEDVVLQYLTDAEYAIRHNRCEVQSTECVMPKKRSSVTIPSQNVAQPAINLPDVLPAGLADAIVSGARCGGQWLGVAGATVDQAGRVTALDMKPVSATAACRGALDTVLRLSLATNTSIRSSFTSPVLLAGNARNGLCLNEDLPGDALSLPDSTFRVTGAVQSPKVLRRVEPHFPENARRAMGGGHNVLVIVECVISKDGCVRSLRVLKQSPFPEVNGAALLAISQWKFHPGYLDGKPVDVVFNLTVNFMTN